MKICLIFYLGCKTTNATEQILPGTWITIPAQNTECVFPFRYDGKEYTQCTDAGWNCPNCFWCGTQFDVTTNSGWGMCEENCLKVLGRSFPGYFLRYILQLIFNSFTINA